MNPAPRDSAPVTTGGERRSMRAVVRRAYGPPDVLALGELERPSPGENEVLVRVHAAAATIGDHHVVTGKPYLIRLTPYGGLPRPKHPVPGALLAGVVDAVGGRVTTLRPGDAVYGQAEHGAFAEYAVVRADRLAPKPVDLTFEEAAALPWAAAALCGLRDAGRLVAGQRVLIIGGSGGVGTWAVQIARTLGAEVTAVCSPRNVGRMRTLGAHAVIDYRREDFATGGPRFDLILDLVGDRSVPDCRRALTPRGTYVACAGGGGDWLGPLGRLAHLLVTSCLTRQRLTTFVMVPRRDDLLFLSALVERGDLKPVIERIYPLGEAAEALRHVGEGHSQGQTILRICA